MVMSCQVRHNSRPGTRLSVGTPAYCSEYEYHQSHEALECQKRIRVTCHHLTAVLTSRGPNPCLIPDFVIVHATLQDGQAYTQGANTVVGAALRHLRTRTEASMCPDTTTALVPFESFQLWLTSTALHLDVARMALVVASHCPR